MAKQLDEKTVLNELHGESAFFGPSPTPGRKSTPQRVRAKDWRKDDAKTDAKREAVPSQAGAEGQKPSCQSIDHLHDRSARQSPGRVTGPSDNKSFDPQANRLAGLSVETTGSKSTARAFDMSLILPKPKAFYITEKQNEDLDVLVKKLAEKVKGKVAQKMDRSVATRLIFENVGLASDETAEQLANLLISRLTSQLTGQPED